MSGASNSLSVVYLGGLGRSGSTLIERTVGSLPDVCAVGELVHLWERGLTRNELCGCGQSFRSCHFWEEVGRRAFGGWDKVDVGSVAHLRQGVDRNRFITLLAAPWQPRTFRQKLEAHNRLYEQLYASILEVSGARTVVDSSKHASLAFCLRTSQRIHLRVVHVLRDSPGVAFSWSKAVRRPEVRDGVSYMRRYSALRVALLWNMHNAFFWLLRRRGTETLVLPYEQFIAGPRAATRSVARFAGLPDDDEALRFLSESAVELSVAHTVAGNPMRFTTGRIGLQSDDDWRSGLPKIKRQLVMMLTFPVRLAFGYFGVVGRETSRE
jgi:hypothetical protein